MVDNKREARKIVNHLKTYENLRDRTFSDEEYLAVVECFNVRLCEGGGIMAGPEMGNEPSMMHFVYDHLADFTRVLEKRKAERRGSAGLVRVK